MSQCYVDVPIVLPADAPREDWTFARTFGLGGSDVAAACGLNPWKTIVGTLLAALVSFGLLNADQATALNNVVAALVTLITFITSAVAQFHVADHAEPQVTPLEDPRDELGRPLVPATDEPAEPTP